MNMHEILLTIDRNIYVNNENTLIDRLKFIFPEDEWGIDCNLNEYSDENKQSIWDHETRAAIKKSIAKNSKNQSDYKEWLGEVYFSFTSIYIKEVFDAYRKNAGWRIALISIPRANIIAVGIASHYQNAQNHGKLGKVSNFFYDFTNDALANNGMQLPGREITSSDWDRDGLFNSPITNVDGVDISSEVPEGLYLKDVRNTTLKKILSSFISVKVLPSNIADSDLKQELQALATIAKTLHSSIYPYKTLQEFESLRALALQDMANAKTRIALMKKSSTRSIVRIYYGPPGTGKTLTAVAEAVKIIDPSIGDNADAKTYFGIFNQRHERCAFITFHPSLQYEDLVESIRPVLSLPEEFSANDDEENKIVRDFGGLRYIIHEGLLLRMIRKALKNPNDEFVIVIDEINRGDISRILGPLISALEPDKRVGAEFPIGFELQYPLALELESRLFMPSNLHILGTMNSSDRNIALVDHALRRRFDFIEIPPDPSILKDTEDTPAINCRVLLETINKRISSLLGHDFCIGHGYFCYCKKNSDVIESMAKKIIPLLKEYFYGSENLMLLILGDNDSHQYNFFVKPETEEDFQRNFSISQDIAETMGYQPYTAPKNIQLDPRFWNPHKLVPQPDDMDYAIKCIQKLSTIPDEQF